MPLEEGDVLGSWPKVVGSDQARPAELLPVLRNRARRTGLPRLHSEGSSVERRSETRSALETSMR